MSLLLSFNLFASTAELGSLMDEHQFFLTVEWDQKDQAFKNKQIELLSSKMGELFKKGLTAADVNKLIDARFHNSKIAEAARLKLSLMGNKLTPANVVEVLKDNSSDIYANGASWNGNAQIFVWGGVIVAIIAIAVAYSKWKDANYVCTQYAIADYCTDFYECDDRFGCDYDGTECGSYERCIKEERVGIE
jgi:hypothetical protein